MLLSTVSVTVQMGAMNWPQDLDGQIRFVEFYLVIDFTQVCRYIASSSWSWSSSSHGQGNGQGRSRLMVMVMDGHDRRRSSSRHCRRRHLPSFKFFGPTFPITN